MRGERRLLRLGEYLIACACRRLPAETRDERYREWAAELPAILRDPDTRLAARRAARMLGYAAGTLWGTALAPGSARRLMARMAGIAARAAICGVVIYLEGWLKTPKDWIGAGIGFFLGSLAYSGTRFAYRRKRGKGLGDELTEAPARARARVELRPAGERIRWAGHQHGQRHRGPLLPRPLAPGLPDSRGG